MQGRVLRDLSAVNNSNVAPAKEDKREYFPVEIESFPASTQEKYNKYRALRIAAAEAKEAFENDMDAIMPKAVEIPAGKQIAYWYNFGQLNVSFEDVKFKKKATSKPSITFKA